MTVLLLPSMVARVVLRPRATSLDASKPFSCRRFHIVRGFTGRATP
jgi:hypothetical protein